MGILARASDWLTRRLPTAAAPGGPVVYTRAADASTVTLTGVAWVGRTAFRRFPTGTEGTEAAALVWGDRDYLIPVSALGATPPARGDRITETVNGTQVVFEVTSVVPGEPEWRYADEHRTCYRVHTLEVG